MGKEGFKNLKNKMVNGKPTPVKKSKAPKQVTADQMVGKTKSGESKRAWKLLFESFAGSGKSKMLLSIPEYEFEKLGTPPSQVKIEYLDMDDGTQPLLVQMPEEYLPYINYTLCTNFDEWIDAYERSRNSLMEHYKKKGHRGWLLVDNIGKLWEWARNKFCEDSYGMTMQELLEMRRKEAMERSKRTLPTFDQLVDYAVINPLHNDIMEEIKVISGQGHFNFIWTVPMYEYDGEYSLGGQKDNAFRVDYEFRLYTEGKGDNTKYFCDQVSTKGRGISRPVVRIANPTMIQIAKAIALQKTIEKKKLQNDGINRKSLLKRLALKEVTTGDPEPLKKESKPKTKTETKKTEKPTDDDDFFSDDFDSPEDVKIIPLDHQTEEEKTAKKEIIATAGQPEDDEPITTEKKSEDESTDWDDFGDWGDDKSEEEKKPKKTEKTKEVKKSKALNKKKEKPVKTAKDDEGDDLAW